MQMAIQTVSVAVATRAFPGESVSGDAWQVDWDGPACRIAVIDGLGHGPMAAAAAMQATGALAADPTMDPVEAIRSCHDALTGTRGAAMLVVRIDVPAGLLTLAGVGNVEARLWQESRGTRLMTDRGIVGSVMPRMRPIDLVVDGDWFLLIYTDGVSGRFGLEELFDAGIEAKDFPDEVLARWGRATDDATVLMAQRR
jgi:serine phosphatase RsbU (regulator of sigma subunit)